MYGAARYRAAGQILTQEHKKAWASWHLGEDDNDNDDDDDDDDSHSDSNTHSSHADDDTHSDSDSESPDVGRRGGTQAVRARGRGRGRAGRGSRGGSRGRGTSSTTPGSPNPRRVGRPRTPHWEAQDDEYLVEHWDDGYEALSRHFGRSVRAVRSRWSFMLTGRIERLSNWRWGGSDAPRRR